MTDTPPTTLPPSRLDAIKTFIGDLARPFAIIWTALCAGVATIMLASKIDDPVQAGVFIGVVYTTGVAPLFIGKAVEVLRTNQAAAEVEKVKAAKEA